MFCHFQCKLLVFASHIGNGYQQSLAFFQTYFISRLECAPGIVNACYRYVWIGINWLRIGEDVEVFICEVNYYGLLVIRRKVIKMHPISLLSQNHSFLFLFIVRDQLLNMLRTIVDKIIVVALASTDISLTT